MANPTTNFGWVMPTSSSLVTNLPADFNTFGQAVDTSMSELLGGTTGQVLSKTSNTNMDFTWVTPTDQTPLTTKGDLFTFTTVDARLGVGTNGQTLVADSSTATGLKWATPSSSSFVGSMCYNASNVSIPNATYTQITWGNETFDAGNIHAASSAVFVTNATGYWLIHGVIQWDTGASGFCQIYVNRKSGATNTTMAGTTRFDSTSYIPLPFSLVVSCTSGDELSVYGYQNSGGARNIQGGGENKTYISVSYLGA